MFVIPGYELDYEDDAGNNPRCNISNFWDLEMNSTTPVRSWPFTFTQFNNVIEDFKSQHKRNPVINIPRDMETVWSKLDVLVTGEGNRATTLSGCQLRFDVDTFTLD